MAAAAEDLSDIHILGPKTTETRIFAAQCPALARVGFKHVGVIDAASPFHVHRASAGGAFLFACFGGQGEVMIEGEWRKVRPGTAFLSPAHIRYGLRAIRGSRWQFCWVRYDEATEAPAAWKFVAPESAPFEAAPMRAAILGLADELGGSPDSAAQLLWVELIQHCALRFAPAHRVDERLVLLWTRVASRLAEPWTLDGLASSTHLSAEHFRRLCQQQLGRSPMRHLLSLRMRHALELLAGTDFKQEDIAARIGYADTFSFSKAFKRWSGLSPSAVRQRHRGSDGERTIG